MNLASRGVETRRVPTDNGRVDLDRLAEACDRRTRIVSVSWVGYASGWRIDPAEVAELAHERGALLFVDAIQGLGAFPLDAHAAGIDFLAADSHKWMLGPEGAGLLFVRREHLDRLRPLGVGWHSVAHSFDYTKIELDLKAFGRALRGGLGQRRRVSGNGRKPGIAARPGHRGDRPADSGNHRSGICPAGRDRLPRSPACAKGTIVPGSCCLKFPARIRWRWFSDCSARGSSCGAAAASCGSARTPISTKRTSSG